MPSLPRRLARRARGAGAILRRGPRRLLARRILAAGLFDQSWYHLQAGREWAEPVAAVVHYLARGRRAGLSPHPLLEPEWVAPTRWESGRRDPVELYLAGGSARGGPHPLFDDATYLAVEPGARTHPGGPLGHFLARADPDDRLPSPPGSGSATLRQLRSALEVAVRQVLEQRALGGRRTTDTWDAAAEQAYLEQWVHTNLPVTDGSEPLVTVVLPVRNRPDQVVAAVQSVLGQTWTGWELLVVDDGSTDDTAARVVGTALGDERVRLVPIPASGAAAARNAGLAAARGRYVAFLDSDNSWVPHFLRTMLAVMLAGGVRAAHAVVEMRSPTGTRYLAHEGGRAELEVVNHIDLNTFVAELDLLRGVGGFDPTLRRMIDWDLVLKVSGVCEPVLVPFVGVHYTDAASAADRISVREPTAWGEVVKARNVGDWSALQSAAPGRDVDVVSVVVTVRDEWAAALSLVDAALAAPTGVEVVAVDRGSRPATARILAGRACTDPRVRVLRQPVDGRTALAWSVGLAATSGAAVVLADATCSARPTSSTPGEPWWRPLATALQDPSVAASAPVVLGPHTTVTSAGLGRHQVDAPTYPMFEAAAPEDVAAGGPLDVVALGDDVLAARAEDLVRLGGADPWYVSAGWGADLSVRLAAHGPARRRLLVEPAVALVRSTVASPPAADDEAGLHERCGALLAAPPDWAEATSWQRAGLTLADVRGTPPRPRLARRREQVTDGPAAGLPALRWTLATAAPFSVHGDRWGDVHFAADLAAALRRHGQHVVVERRDTAGRSTTAFDEVFLVLRGLVRERARAGQVNLLWVISHPDLVDEAEVRSFDAVFSAGTVWARGMSDRSGVDVVPLLQATDPSRFHPDLAAPDTGPPVLFVGNSRGAVRPVVRDAVEAGLDLSVYGTRWDGFVDPRYVKGSYIPNERLGAAYRAAGVVLNDHWPDMREQGFLSNRLFDAVAAGARVVSDPVPGLDTTFHGAVLAYRTVEDLRRLTGTGRDEAFGSDQRRREISERVHREHSFDARAGALLDTVLRIRS
jgi:O-antigen biosynthesis protein